MFFGVGTSAQARSASSLVAAGSPEARMGPASRKSLFACASAEPPPRSLSWALTEARASGRLASASEAGDEFGDEAFGDSFGEFEVEGGGEGTSPPPLDNPFLEEPEPATTPPPATTEAEDEFGEFGDDGFEDETPAAPTTQPASTGDDEDGEFSEFDEDVFEDFN